MTKIIKSEPWNRTLVCFGSNAVDSRQRADVRAVYFDDRLVGRSTGKTKSPFTFSSRLAKTAQAFTVSGTLLLAAFVLPKGLKEIATFKMNILAPNAANFFGTHSGFEHHRRYVSKRLRR